jgi:hypothetical protein
MDSTTLLLIPGFQKDFKLFLLLLMNTFYGIDVLPILQCLSLIKQLQFCLKKLLIVKLVISRNHPSFLLNHLCLTLLKCLKLFTQMFGDPSPPLLTVLNTL